MRAVWLTVWLVLLAGCAQTPTSPGAMEAAEALVITRHPVDQKVTRLDSATFAVQVAGSGPLTYQWFRDGRPAPLGNAPAVTLRKVTENDVGIYAVTISNPAGSITSIGARLSLEGAPPGTPSRAAAPVAAISHQDPTVGPPVGRRRTETFEQGKPLHLAVLADGTRPFTYRWYRNAERLADGTGETYRQPHAHPDHAGTYECVVENAAGTAISPPVRVEVKVPVAGAR